MSNRTGVIYARQSFGQEQDDEDDESTVPSGWCGYDMWWCFGKG